MTDSPEKYCTRSLVRDPHSCWCHVHGLEWEHGQLARKSTKKPKSYVPLLNSSIKSKKLKESVRAAINQKIYSPFLFYCCPWFMCEPKESITWKSLNDKRGPAHLYTHEAKRAKEIFCIGVRLLRWAGGSRTDRGVAFNSRSTQRRKRERKPRALTFALPGTGGGGWNTDTGDAAEVLRCLRCGSRGTSDQELDLAKV